MGQIALILALDTNARVCDLRLARRQRTFLIRRVIRSSPLFRPQPARGRRLAALSAMTSTGSKYWSAGVCESPCEDPAVGALRSAFSADLFSGRLRPHVGALGVVATLECPIRTPWARCECREPRRDLITLFLLTAGSISHLFSHCILHDEELPAIFPRVRSTKAHPQHASLVP